MMRVAGSTLLMQVLILLACDFMSRTSSASPSHNDSDQNRTLCVISFEAKSLHNQFRKIASRCHPENLSGITSDHNQATCAYSEYLRIVHKDVHVSNDTKRRIEELKNQFDDIFVKHGCNVTLELNSKIRSKDAFALKCLGLHVLESLTLWFQKNDYHKCGRNH